MGRKQLEVLEYDKVKAKKYFILFKFFELFGVFLFVVGFHSFGSFIHNKLPWFCIAVGCESFSSYFGLWVIGFLGFVIIVGLLLAVGNLSYLIYLILKAWFEINWKQAKLYSEDEDAKKERLKEQEKLKVIKEIEEKEEQRKKWGFCVGDEAEYIKRDEEDKNFKSIGDKCKILKIDGEGDIEPEWGDGEAGGDGGRYMYANNFKFIKKPLPKKPKLSKVRQKEIDEKLRDKDGK